MKTLFHIDMKEMKTPNFREKNKRPNLRNRLVRKVQLRETG